MRYGSLLVGLCALWGVSSCTTTPEGLAKESAPPPVAPQISKHSVTPVKSATVASSSASLPSPAEGTFEVPPAPEVSEAVSSKPPEMTIAPPGSSVNEQVTGKPSTASRLAETTPAHTASSGNIGLSVKMPFGQAWSAVGKALPASGYQVMEQDNVSGIYYILDKVSSGGKIKRDTPIYQMKLQKDGESTTLVTLSNAQSQPVDPALAKRILGAVKGQLD